MKILYGIQGTGNGHISRANAMADSFKAHPDIDITWLLSGRDKKLGCGGGIKTFLWRRGLTFSIKNGRINSFKTLYQNNIFTLLNDIKHLNLKPYDLLISDFEPVMCHAAKKRGLPIIGIGHQYAFDYKIPITGENVVSKLIMRNYAPVSQGVGLHWHHFDQSILPPILDLKIPDTLPEKIKNKVLVYLPFESLEKIVNILEELKQYEFYIYHPQASNIDKDNIHFRSYSRHGFKNDLLNAQKVICNSGFELISECLKVGKNILTKPLQGQMEQLSNAKALEELAYAEVIQTFNLPAIESWLEKDEPVTQVNYPDVASKLTNWIAGGRKQTIESLSSQLWESTYNSFR